MKSFCLSSLLLVLLSCVKMKNPKDTEIIECESQIESKKNDSIRSQKYITKATIYGKTINGILFIKYLDKNQVRTAFTSIVGIKLFELILTSDTDSTVYCIAQWQKDKIIQFIAKDIKLIVFEPSVVSKCFKSIDNTVKIKESISEFERYRYFYNSDYRQLNKIYSINHNNKLKAKYMFQYQNGLISQIDIEHMKISLNIQLVAYQ